ncbi:hypothetical protein D3C75_985790 [compost metagenome]
MKPFHIHFTHFLRLLPAAKNEDKVAVSIPAVPDVAVRLQNLPGDIPHGILKQKSIGLLPSAEHLLRPYHHQQERVPRTERELIFLQPFGQRRRLRQLA